MSINLLPWRTKQHYHNLRLFIFNILILLILFLTAYYFLYSQNQQSFATQTAQQQYWQQLNLQLNKLEKRINQLNQDNHLMTTFTTAQLQQVFQLLNELPLTQGELHQLQWQEDQLTLIGESADQLEFEQIHQFLRQQTSFEQIKLRQFTPLSEGLFFQFDLQLRKNK